MNIYELEALILADIEIFNKEYKTNIQNRGNVMHQANPKEFLKQKTHRLPKEYSESHCPDLFKKLRYQTVEKNCRYFKEFTQQFQKQLNSKPKQANSK